MNASDFSEKELTEIIQHIVHDNLPIASIKGTFIVPKGSREIEGRETYDTYTDPTYGDFVLVGAKKLS